MGWGHRKTALGEYGLMVATGVSATVMIGKTLLFQLSGLVLWLVVYAVLTIQISRLWRRGATQ
jgi:hypothetical protein